jgi:hypothetical protein
VVGEMRKGERGRRSQGRGAPLLFFYYCSPARGRPLTLAVSTTPLWPRSVRAVKFRCR